MLVERLRKKQPTEVSTGYWAVSHTDEGLYNEKEYDEVVDLIIPDHLAFLPNDVGACNWADGCGVPRVNQQETLFSEDEMREIGRRTAEKLGESAATILKQGLVTDMNPIQTNLTVTDQFAMLARLVAMEAEEQGMDLWQWHIMDIEGSTVIVMWQGKILRREFAINESDNIEFTGEWEEVVRQTTFVTAKDNAICQCGGTIKSQAESTQEEEAEMPEDAKQVENIEHVDTLQAFLDQNSTTKEAIIEALKVQSEARQELIAEVSQNTGIDKADLEQLSAQMLDTLAQKTRSIVTIAEEPTSATEITGQTVENFSGRGMPVTQSRPEEVPERPSVLRSIKNTHNTDALSGRQSA